MKPNQSRDCNGIKSFFDNLKSLRSIFSNLDVKSFKRDIPPLLRKLLHNTSNVHNFFKYDKQNSFLASLTNLERFSFRSLDNVINLIILLDECYYSLYYSLQLYNANIISSSKYTQSNDAIIIPKPHAYFTTLIGNESHLKQFIKEFMIQNFPNDFIIEFSLLWDIDRKHYNPLLHLQYSRWRETICLMSVLNLFSKDITILLQSCKANHLISTASLTMKGTDPLVPTMIRSIYDSNRIWPCHLYAFATPSIDALKKLASLSPIIEIGSGTGYWAHLIIKYHHNNQIANNTKNQQQQVAPIAVYAYDRNPPSVLKHSKVNEYHGQSRSWTDVLAGGPEVLSKHPNATLFLCYPPPDNDMALLALRSYKGKIVAYVGEIHGDTGSKSFEIELFKFFICEEIIKLPNWGDTCYSLMIWNRKAKHNINKPVSIQKYLPYSCSYCKQQAATTQLYRCRLTYSIYFCSSLCASLGHVLHQYELTMRYLLCKPTKSSSSLKANNNNTCSNSMKQSEEQIIPVNISFDKVGMHENISKMTKKQLKRKRKLEEYIKEHEEESIITCPIVVNNNNNNSMNNNSNNNNNYNNNQKVIETNMKLPLIELNNTWYRIIKNLCFYSN